MRINLIGRLSEINRGIVHVSQDYEVINMMGPHLNRPCPPGKQIVDIEHDEFKVALWVTNKKS